MSRLFSWMPRGRALPPDAWSARHRGLLLVLIAHLIALPAFAVTQGWSLGAAWAFDAVPAVFGALACIQTLSPAVRSCLCAVALLACSAVLVVAWHGTPEAHFHYFVTVGALALYEEVWAYVLAIGFVVFQHGVMGALRAETVFHHMEDPWRWAGVHGLFVAALAVANVVSWRENERGRAATAASEDRFRRAFDDAPVPMALLAPDGRVLQGNTALRTRTGFDTVEGLWFWDFVPAGDRRQMREDWPETADAERRFVRADGSIGWIHWRHSLVLTPGGRPDHYVSQGVDITARKRDAERLDHLAHHDPLTGLPNRARFDRLLAEALERDAGDLAVVFADIDDFKVINDSLGHRTGDELLKAVADRLSAELRPDDVLARFGGDEFVILLNTVDDAEAVRTVADRLAASLSRPFTLAGRQRFVSASFGIAFPGDHGEAESLIRDADAAMYQAKRQGKARLEVFDESLRARALERLELEAGLRDALAQGQLELALSARVLARGRFAVRDGGAAALDPSGARDDLPRALRADRRAERPDRADRRVGAGQGLHPGRRLARRRPRGLRDGGQPLTAPALLPHARAGRRRHAGDHAGCRRRRCAWRSPRARSWRTRSPGTPSCSR